MKKHSARSNAAAQDQRCHHVCIYNTPFVHESRILKTTDTLIKNGMFAKVSIFAMWRPGLAEQQMLDDKRQVYRIRTIGLSRKFGKVGRVVRELEWQLRVFWRVLRLAPDCINCHNIWLLPLCTLLKLCTSSRLIYDTHELETETSNSLGLRKLLSKVVERGTVPFADLVIVVSESIATWYRETYKLDNIYVVRNLPASQATPARGTTLREIFHIADDELVFLYQGLISGGRGIEILLDTFSRADYRKHLIFLGYGPQKDLVRSYADRYANIHFLDAVPPDDLPPITRSADVGLSLIENVSLSYYYCLPNKLFEYLSCGLPVIVSDFPEMAAVVTEHDCGWTTSVSASQLGPVIASITRDDVISKSKAVARSAHLFTWEQEEPALLRAYAEGLPFLSARDRFPQTEKVA